MTYRNRYKKIRGKFGTCMMLCLSFLLVSTLGSVIDGKIGQLVPPSKGSWSTFMSTPTGSGTSSSPYKVTTAGQLAYFLGNGSNAYVVLENDIDLAEHTWEGINGTRITNFNGQNHTISNLNGTQGLFASVPSVVKNVNFSNVDISAGAYIAGAVGGLSSTTISVTNVNVTSGRIVSSLGAGGVIGLAIGTVENCTNNAEITTIGNAQASGISGGSSANVKNCINTGDITAENGNVAGIAASANVVENCFSEGRISGAGTVAGIAASGTIKNSGFNGTLVGLSDSVSNVFTIGANAQSSFAVADVYLKSESTSAVKAFGATSATNSYNFANVYNSAATKKEIRKYKYDSESTAFSEFAYHKNINGGFPFPKSLFAVGQFLDGGVFEYLADNGFSAVDVSIQNDGTHYYVELGKYPQTYVGDSLNSTLKSWYTNSSPASVDSYTNDLGTGSNTITHYAYKYTDGNTYVRVASAITNSSGYKFQDDTTVAVNGSEYWFKVEPIKWWVLNYEATQSGAAPIVLAEQALTANVTWNKTYVSGEDYNLWYNSERCNIRNWLNGQFYNDAFDGGYQDFIKTTAVKNHDNKTYDYNDSYTTNDNVWLLSYREVYGETYSSEAYFNTSTSRLCSPTDYAIVNKCYLYTNASYPTEIRKNGGTCGFWLRSAYTSNTTSARYVSNYGNMNYYSVTYTNYAVRPALTLNL